MLFFSFAPRGAKLQTSPTQVIEALVFRILGTRNPDSALDFHNTESAKLLIPKLAALTASSF